MATKSGATVQQVLARKLPGLTTAQLKSIAQTIAGAQANGLKVDDVFPEGILEPDSVTIGGTLDMKDLPKLGDIIKALDKFKGVQVFPRGIPVTPDAMRVKLTLHR